MGWQEIIVYGIGYTLMVLSCILFATSVIYVLWCMLDPRHKAMIIQDIQEAFSDDEYPNEQKEKR